MDFQPILILSSFLSVVQIILTMLPGVWYTRKGLFNRDTRRVLSTIAFNLLLPCVVFMNISGNVTASTIASYWPFCMNTCISMVVGTFLGWVINQVFATPKHLRYHVIACSGMPNLNSLPLMITTAVCNQKNMPFYQTLGSQCVTVGWAYVAVSSAVNQIFGFPVSRWLLIKRPEPPPSFVQVLQTISRRTLGGVSRRTLGAISRHLSAAPSKVQGDVQVGTDRPRPSKAASAPHSISLDWQPPNGSASRGDAAAPALATVPEDGTSADSSGPEEAERQLDRVESGAQVTPAKQSTSKESPSDRSIEEKEEDGEDSEDEGSNEAAAAGKVAAPEAPPKQRNAVVRGALLVWHYIYEYGMTMPTISAVVSLGIGCAAPLRKLFFPQQSAPLGFITGAIQSLQNSYVFVASFVLGSAMAWGPGPGTRSVGLRSVMAVVAVRFLILPLLGAIIVVGTIKMGWFFPKDPVFAFLLMLQYSVPTSNQVQNMASMFQNHEKEIGAIIFWQYMVALLAIPGWMIFYLFLMDFFNLYPGA